MDTIAAGFSLVIILAFYTFAGAMTFNILRIFTHLLIALVTRGRATGEKAELFGDSLAAGLVAALMFALQLAKPAP